MKHRVLSVFHQPKSAGHWTVTVETETADDIVTLTGVTTDSRAIDGYDGGDQSLAQGVLSDNGYDCDDFDLDFIDGGKDDE